MQRHWAWIIGLGLWLALLGCEPYAGPPRIVDDVSWKSQTPPPSQPKPRPRTTERPVTPTDRPLAGRTIIVDPGHGGHDPGAGEAGFSPVPEKTIVLEIARIVAQGLQAQGANVIMTRNSDRFVELLDRAAIAERNHADLLVSIHADSHRDSRINGPTVYIARAASAQSKRVANGVHAAFRDAGIASHGIRRADFKVLAAHSRPAILVESGYLTNGHEARNLNSNWYRRKIAACIVDGITRALGR